MQTSVRMCAFMQAIEGKVFQDLIHFDIEVKYCSIMPFFFFLNHTGAGVACLQSEDKARILEFSLEWILN